MRFYRISLVAFFFTLAGTAVAGSGIATSSFTIPNNTGRTFDGLNVTLSNPAASFSSSQFSTSSFTANTYDFSNGSVASGFNDSLFATSLEGNSLEFIGITSFEWTTGGASQGLEYPLVPQAFMMPTLVGSNVETITSVALLNTTGNELSYTNATFTVDQTLTFSNQSGAVLANSSVTLFSTFNSVSNLNLSFNDGGTGVQETVSFDSAPEPATLPLTAAILLCGAVCLRRFRRARG